MASEKTFLRTTLAITHFCEYFLSELDSNIEHFLEQADTYHYLDSNMNICSIFKC